MERIERYDSTGAFLAAAEAHVDRKRGGAYLEAANRQNGEWSYGVGFEQAVVLGRNGWAEGRERIAQISGNMIESLSSRIKFETWAPKEEGEFFSIEDVLQGEPECWRQLVQVEGEGTAHKRVRIAVAGSAPGSVTAECINLRGSAICALLDLLEVSGHQVEVTVTWAVTGYGSDCVADTVTVKRYDERADLGMLAFWLAHPAAQRRIAWANREGRDSATRRSYDVYVGGEYGATAEKPTEAMIGYTPDLVIARPSAYDWSTIEQTRAWVKKTLESLGVKFVE